MQNRLRGPGRSGAGRLPRSPHRGTNLIARALPLTLTLGLGCSLITDLDFVGGQVDSGGTSSSGGDTSGGITALGGQGSGGDTPINNGGRAGETMTLGGSTSNVEGGAAGETGGMGPEGGTSGGSAPLGGSMGMTGGEAGAGAASGGGGEGGGCSGAGCCEPGQEYCDGACVDTQTDVLHCGSCENACTKGIACEKGLCITDACVGICEQPEVLRMSTSHDGYRADNIGVEARCFIAPPEYMPTSAPQLICWNFVSQRTLRVNGVETPCDAAGVKLGPRRAGSYCVEVSAGDYSYAGLKFPVP